ncbi:hypothetical protein [uncultured Fluviicola sp.]|uniref:hypothetical protein n=1 Tax=uncultured Fluviicola sp. TaxID=463303 RepID=UPI0025F80B53|nr:hypothetical protein [uncultured Fluviicola sp.]
MIYTQIKYLRIGSVAGGLLMLIISVFLPYYVTCEWNSEESGTIEVLVLSYTSGVFWLQFLFTIALFVSGYFYRDIVNKALLYTFSSMLIVCLLLTWDPPTFGATPCGRSSQIGRNLSVFGSCFVILGTFISIYREEE